MTPTSDNDSSEASAPEGGDGTGDTPVGISQEMLLAALMGTLTEDAPTSALRSPEALPRLFRAGSMLGAVLSDLDDDLDEGACVQAAQVWNNGHLLIVESVSADLGGELDRMVTPFAGTPSPAMLRVGYQQLCSWVRAVVSQEMSQLTAASVRAELVGQMPSSELDASESAPIAPRSGGYL